MRHRKPDQEPLRPTIVPVKLTAREREAYRRLSSQRSASRRPLGFDPLELRLGLRAQYRSQRPHYAISNPQYDQVLKRCPEHDDSLPGLAWLRSVYRRHSELVALPRARAAVAARFEQAEREMRPRPPAVTLPPVPCQFELLLEKPE
jgi:hypothetical protein